jgi:3-hydroxybutyryl-CoA dehydrogenase
MMNVKNVIVVGAGAMGTGIVQACAEAGYHVIMMDVDQTKLKKATEVIQSILSKLDEKGRLRESKSEILSRIEVSSSLDSAKKCELALEAIFENLEAKQDIFRKLDSVCSQDALLCTNTSSIPISKIASVVKFPERVLGVHFFNPVHRMKLVEIVMGLRTLEEAVTGAREFVLSLGKDPVIVKKDIAGFIVNRINGMAFLEAMRLLDRGVATAEDIDKAMRMGLGYPMGPFELMDFIGLDVVLNARTAIYKETREPSHYPPEFLRRMVDAGSLGRKTGKGFYNY